MSLLPQPSMAMSHKTPRAPFQEDAFTPGRPPQYNDSNQAGGQGPPSTNSTNATLTATQNEVPEATSSPATDPSPRSYIRYYAEHDYDNPSWYSTQLLTENALSALNNRYAGPWNANPGGQNYALSQFMMDSNTPMRRVPQTHTVARTGTASSRTAGAHLADPVPQTDDMADNIRAVGWQFDDVSASPSGLVLLHEDCQ
ncbi:hypothetical protein F5B17DRAFT_154304 [Nemania serpens]|nr:hypothetical protein F5B17DRAFT_154304 [Nemania serpens]